uniref:hypothetical protein n=1 Tax=Leptothermofonsia sichuanensis TaxID=2917832 RepID=UPI001CEDA97D
MPGTQAEPEWMDLFTRSIQVWHFDTLQVLPHWRTAFPQLVSYNRFVELMPWSLMLLCCFLLRFT